MTRERRPQVRVLPLADPRVAASWRRLQARGAVCTPFLSWEWLRTLAELPAAAPGAIAVLVERAGEAIGALPLERTTGPSGLRVVHVAAGRWCAPDHLDVVAAPGARRDVTAAIVRYLGRHGDFDALDLDGLSADGALRGGLRPCPLRAVRRRPEPVRCPYVRLHGRARAELLASRNLRQQIGRGLREAERRGGGFDVVTEPDDVARSMDTLMELHNARFGAASAVFSDEVRRRFHRRTAYHLARAGHARVYRLRAAGTDAALMYVVTFGGTYYYYSMGMRPDVTPSPGRTLLGHAILAAAEDGAEEFDLLRGEHEFKMRFASGVRDDVRERFVRPTWRSGRAAVAALARRRSSPAG